MFRMQYRSDTLNQTTWGPLKKTAGKAKRNEMSFPLAAQVVVSLTDKLLIHTALQRGV